MDFVFGLLATTIHLKSGRRPNIEMDCRTYH